MLFLLLLFRSEIPFRRDRHSTSGILCFPAVVRVFVFRRDYSYVPTQAIQPLAWMSARYETQNHDSRMSICRGTSRPSFSASRWGGTESASATGQYLRNPARGSI